MRGELLGGGRVAAMDALAGRAQLAGGALGPRARAEPLEGRQRGVQLDARVDAPAPDTVMPTPTDATGYAGDH